MGWTKRQFIEQAFDEIGLASYAYDLSPDELQSALRVMDSMLANWNGRGIRIGYPLSGTPGSSNIDINSGVPDSANEAIYASLALRIAPSFGKVVSMETRQGATSGYNTLLSRATMPNEMQFPGTMPSGSGNKPWRLNRDPFIKNPVDPVDVGPDGTLDLY